MSNINGKYLYNLTTGETIGVRKSKASEEDGLQGDEKTRSVYNTDAEDSHGGWVDYYILGDNYNISNKEYGTVEDLSLTQIVELFLAGNLTKAELEVGLKSKNVENLNINENDSNITASFDINDKHYNISCSTEAAASQIDSVTIQDWSANISITSNNLGIRIFEEQGNELLNAYHSMSGTLNSTAGATWMLYHEKAFGFENIKESARMINSVTVARYLDEQAAFCLAYFGYDIPESPRGCLYQTLTPEQRAFVYAHPEIFHYIGNPGEGNEENFYNPYGSTEGNYEFFPDAVMTKYILEQFKAEGQYVSPDMQYCASLEEFMKSIGSDHQNPIKNLQLNGNNVSWDSNTVDAYYNYLQNNLKYEDMKVYPGTTDEHLKDCWNKVKEILGLTISDITGLSESELKAKISSRLEGFFKSCGSTDGKTLHIEDYYNSLGPLVHTYADFQRVYQEQEVQLYNIAEAEEELYAQHGGSFNPADYRSEALALTNDRRSAESDSNQVNPDLLKGLEGIALDPNPENATYEDYKAMLILTNFLRANFTDSGSPIASFDIQGILEVQDKWAVLPNGKKLTEANWQQYKNLIPLLDKEEAIQKAIEKLMQHSCQINSITQSVDQPEKVISEWLTDLLNACGATNVKIESFGKDAGGVTGSFAYVKPAYISFEIDGHKYVMGVKQPATGCQPPSSAIVPAEQVEELRQYMPEDEFERVLNYYFTPVFTVDGKVKTYMFSWTLDVAGEKRRYGEDPKLVRGNFINGHFTHFEDYWRGDPPNCSSTGFQEMVAWIKSHDLFAMDEYLKTHDNNDWDENLWSLLQNNNDAFTIPNTDTTVTAAPQVNKQALRNNVFSKTTEKSVVDKSGVNGLNRVNSLNKAVEYNTTDNVTETTQDNPVDNNDRTDNNRKRAQGHAGTEGTNTVAFGEGYCTLQSIENHTYSIYRKIVFPGYEYGVMSYDDVIDSMVNQFIYGLQTINNLGTIFSGYWPDAYIYTSEHPKEERNDATPPLFRVCLDKDNNICVGDDAVKCVMAFLKVMKEHNCNNKDAVNYMNLFGFTVDDNESTVRQKMQAFYDSIAGSDGKTSVKEYWLALSNAGFEFTDIDNEYDSMNCKAEFSVIPMNKLKAAVDAQNYFRKSQETIVDYGFTIDNIYGMNWMAGHFDTNKDGIFVLSDYSIKTVLEQGYLNTMFPENSNPGDKELIAALQKAANAYGGVDKLLEAWCHDGYITPEELLARLTGAHEDSKPNECYVTQKSYDKEAMELVFPRIESIIGRSLDECFELRNGRYYLKPGLTTIAGNGATYVDSFDKLGGWVSIQEYIDEIVSAKNNELEVKYSDDLPWLGGSEALSALYALYQNEYGKECLDNRITFNADGSVTVILNGCADNDYYRGLSITLPKSIVNSAKNYSYTGANSGGGELNIILYYLAYEQLYNDVLERAYKHIEENGMFSAFSVDLFTTWEILDSIGNYVSTGIDSEWVQTTCFQGIIPRMQTAILAKRAKAMLDDKQNYPDEQAVFEALYAQVKAESEKNPVPSWWSGINKPKTDEELAQMVREAIANANSGEHLNEWNSFNLTDGLSGLNNLFHEGTWWDAAPFGPTYGLIRDIIGIDRSGHHLAIRGDKYDDCDANALRAYAAVGIDFMATFEMDGDSYIVVNVNDNEISFVKANGVDAASEVQTMSIADFAKKAKNTKITLLNYYQYDELRNKLPDYPDPVESDPFTQWLKQTYPVIDEEQDAKNMQIAAIQQDLEVYDENYKIYRTTASNGQRQYYIWNPYHQNFNYLGEYQDKRTQFGIHPIGAAAMYDGMLAKAYGRGMKCTKEYGIFEKDNVYYKYDPSAPGQFVELTPENSGFGTAGAPVLNDVGDFGDDETTNPDDNTETPTNTGSGNTTVKIGLAENFGKSVRPDLAGGNRLDISGKVEVADNDLNLDQTPTTDQTPVEDQTPEVTEPEGTNGGNRTAPDEGPTYTDDTIGDLLAEWVRKYVGSFEHTISRKVISILYRMCQDGLQLKHDTEIPNTQWDSNGPDAELLGNLLNAYSYTGDSSYSDYSTQFCMRLMQILSNGVELNTVHNNDGSYYYTNSTEYYDNINNNMAKILDAIGATKGEYNLYTNIDFEKFMRYIMDATEPPYNSIAFGPGVYSYLGAEINDITNKGIDSVPYDSSLSKMFTQSGLSWGSLPYEYRVYLSGTSIFENIDYFPNTTGQHITLEDFYSTQALCYIPDLQRMTEKGKIYKGYALYTYLYDGTPLASRPNPPFFRVAIDKNNCIYASDDVVKCVQKYINELIAKGLSCSANKYCQMFGFTENDVNDLELIKQKINNTYKQLGGELGSDGNYHLSWTKYYEKLSNMDITVFDKFNSYVEGSPRIRVISRDAAEANITRMNYWIDSCNAVVDYGFTLADIYGLSSKDTRNLDEFGNAVYSKSFIKDLINGEYDSEKFPYFIYHHNDALIKALKNAASKMGGVDNLINTWFKNSDKISPEEILAWLTGVHPDGSGECFVEPKHYTPEEVNTMCRYSSEYFYPDTSAGNNNIEEFFKPVYDDNGNILYYVMRPGKITSVFNCMETIPFNLEYSQEQQDKLDTLSPILAELGITGELPQVDVDNFVYTHEPKNEYSVQAMYSFASSYVGQECINNMLTINPDGSAVVHLQDYVQYYKPYPGFDIQISPEEMALIINDAVKNSPSVENIKLEIVNYAYKKFIQEVAERVVSYLDKYQEENDNLDIFPDRWYKITILDDYNGDFFGATIEDYDNALRDYDNHSRASELRLGDLMQFNYDIDWQKLIKQYKENPDFDFVQAVLDTFEQTGMEYYMSQLILSSSGRTDLLDNNFPSSEYSCRVISKEPCDERISEVLDKLILLGNAGVEFYGSFSFGHYTGLDGYTCNECTIVNIVGNKVYYTISTENNQTVHEITVDELKRKAGGIEYKVLELDANIDEKIASYKANQTSEIISEETDYANRMAAKYPPLEDNDEKKYAAIGRMKLTLVTRNPVGQFGEAYRDKQGRYYVWSPYKGEMVFVADYSNFEESKIITGLYGKLKDMEEYQASRYIPTTTPGVYYYPETGAYYKYTGCNGATSVTINGRSYNQPFIELTDNDTQNWATDSIGVRIYVETSSPGVYMHSGELYVYNSWGNKFVKVESFALGRAIASMNLYESSCQNVYYDSTCNNYYIWNPTTETMEKMEGITAINERGTQAKGTKYYAYIKAAREGYVPSKTAGIFIKSGHKYTYDAKNDKFVRV